MKTVSSAGCVFSEGRAGRSSRIWQRKTNIKRLVKVNVESGKSVEEIAEFLEIDLSEVQKIAES